MIMIRKSARHGGFDGKNQINTNILNLKLCYRGQSSLFKSYVDVSYHDYYKYYFLAKLILQIQEKSFGFITVP